MSEVDYHIIALLPALRPFDLGEAVEKMRSAGYAAHPQTGPNGEGLRVELDDGWGVVAWLEDDEDAADFAKGLSQTELPQGISADQIASRKTQLSIWSDDDSDFMNGALFDEIVETMRAQFGAFLFDNRLGEWRT